MPEGWASGPVLNFFQLQRGHDLPVQDRSPGPVPVIASNGAVGSHDQSPFPGPGVITGRSGTIGNVSYVEGAYWPLNTTLYLRDFKGADPKFVYYFLQNFPLKDHQSGTGVPTLNRNDVHAVDVVFPPLDEQRRIVEVLQSVDEAIAAKQATLAATKQFKRTCREAAVMRFQDCAPTALRSVLVSIDAGWSPDCESEPANDGQWSILKTSSVVWEGYDDTENKRLPAHLGPRPHLEVTADDILITRAGPAERTGVVAIVRETAGRRMLSDKIIRLRASPEKAVPLAIAELLSSDHVQAELIRSKSGMAASQTNISQKIVLGLEMRLPSLADQKDFANEMAALQDAIEIGEADLHNAERLKAALMSDLLSGRVRVSA
ncbi:restriction endonuclease subunit S [Mesorhizobium sp. LNHC232B00]|nr:restriction endonuclease subunit S [Mesorhizobium sp. LNHC232B00]